MAFWVTVHHVADRPFLSSPPPIDNDDSFNLWQQQAAELLILDEFVGYDSDVERYWSAPAANLGLPILARLHQQGVDVEGDQLEHLNRELDRLELHWSSLADQTVVRKLHQGAVNIREAIQAAVQEQGFLQIG